MKRNFYKAKFLGSIYFNWNRDYRKENYCNCKRNRKGSRNKSLFYL